METAGQHRIIRAEDVAVMGVTEILRHIPRIYLSYRRLVRSIQRDRPDVAVLIDFPDVNFRLARHLARAGVPVLWFVSPQLWAWKRGRLRWVQQRVDKMLVIFPFEETFYRERGVDAEFVGHPLAAIGSGDTIPSDTIPSDTIPGDTVPSDTVPSDTIPGDSGSGDRGSGDSGSGGSGSGDSGTGQAGPGNTQVPQGFSLGSHNPQSGGVLTPESPREAYAARHSLDPAKTWIALLPGSRWKEIRANLPELHALAMSDLISGSAAYTTFDGRTTRQPSDPAAHTRYEFLLPVASTIDPHALRQYIATLNAEHLKYFGPEASTLRLTLVDDARQALTHARASVVASGTATVLAAIVGNPFVVVYRVSDLTFALAKKLVEYPEEFPLKRDLDGNLPVAMPNLIAGRRIVPELLQSRFTAENVAAALTPLLADGPERDHQIAALAEVRAALNPAASPIQRVAEAVLSLLDSSSHAVTPKP